MRCRQCMHKQYVAGNVYFECILEHNLNSFPQMVPFAGYELPVQYPAGVLQSHLHTRAKGELADVVH